MFNKLSNEEYYDVNLNLANNVIANLPDFELEELVISYLQIVKGYYLLSNSIANKSTTVKIECQLISRDVNDVKKAVVQVNDCVPNPSWQKVHRLCGVGAVAV